MKKSQQGVDELASLTLTLETNRHQGLEQAGPRTVAAIRDHSKNLEALDVSGCRSLDSAGLQSILEKAKKLKGLWTNKPSPPGDSNQPGTPILDGVDKLRALWATKSLEVFACAIKVKLPDAFVPVPSPRDRAWRSPSDEHCRAFQRLVYQHLGKQKQLKHLQLGGWGRDPFDCLWYCLEMTLASGLDELKELKKMKTLDFRGMNHNIGIVELKWMNKNWPKLKHIHRIFQRPGPRQAEMRDWIAANKPA